MTNFGLSIDNPSGNSVDIELKLGSSTFLVGANGSGKTRLAARGGKQLDIKAHPSSAHRSLGLNPTVAKISEAQALNGLRFGRAVPVIPQQQIEIRLVNRWSHQAETVLLNDFDFLIQALFADQSNISLETHAAAHAGETWELKFTRFQKIISIWNRILPQRQLRTTGDNILATAAGEESYSAAEMSDGERAIFYMLGQVLLAEVGSVLIFDEPELHVHRAILSRLWDEVEAARPDCAFLVITHDLEFAASRPGQKFSIRRYIFPNKWEVEQVPEDTGFSEEITTLILGSRKPILFVEGTGSSLDLAIYRACYPEWTVLCRGGCEVVIHSVVTMRQNEILTRVRCSGIVDADDYSDAEKEYLSSLGIAVLPVSEVENLFLLPDVARAILIEEKFSEPKLTSRLIDLTNAILEEVSRPGSVEDAALRYCRRRIDRTLKKIDLSKAETSKELSTVYYDATSSLDIERLATEFRERISSAVESRDLNVLLAYFDNKAFLALAARHLKRTTKKEFEDWLTRAVRDPEGNQLKTKLEEIVPVITPL